MMSLATDMSDDHPCEPVLVLSNIPGAGGLAKAEALGIPTRVLDHKAFGKDRLAFEAALHKILEAGQPDIICLAGFMRVLSGDFTAKWAGRMLNIHPSLLPKYRGLHTHARAIEEGETEHGCTVHEVTAELDGGPILGQARVAIGPQESPTSLAAKVLPLEHALYPAVLRRFAQGNRARFDLGM